MENLTTHEAAWILAGLLGLAVIVLLSLWLRTRGLLKKSLANANQAQNSPKQVEIGFEQDTLYSLLSIQPILIRGQTFQHGVVSADKSPPRPFLVRYDMQHLQAGDTFTLRQQQLYKVDVRNAPLADRTLQQPRVAAASKNATAAAKTPALATAQAPQRRPRHTPQRKQPQNQKTDQVTSPAATIHYPPPDSDANDRTVLFSAKSMEQALQRDPLDGVAYLEVVEGPDTGKSFPLNYKRSAIGRVEGSEVRLSDDGASRLHCEVVFQAPHFILRDAGSTNGTLCNDEFTENRQLEFGDKIQVADTVMVFTCQGNELKQSNPDAAIRAFERCLARQPNFLLAMKNLAFLLERDLRRKKEAEPLWKKIAHLERGK